MADSASSKERLYDNKEFLSFWSYGNYMQYSSFYTLNHRFSINNAQYFLAQAINIFLVAIYENQFILP